MVVSSPAARSKIENSSVSSISPPNLSPGTGTRKHEFSVLGRVFRHPRNQGVLTALSLEDRDPQSVGILAEHVRGPRRLDDPIVALELAVKLPRPPARVARENPDVAGAVD